MSISEIIVRRAELSDADEICRLIHCLAEYEKMADKCTATSESIRQMMSEQNGLSAIIAHKDGKAVAMAALSIYKLATFSGKRVLYIEDIYVDAAFRHSGIGGMIFDEIKRFADDLGCIKIEWKCLAWNASAREFYQKHGGISDPEWLTYTIDLRKE